MKTLKQKLEETKSEEAEAAALPSLEASSENCEGTPRDLTELFNINPINLTDNDISEMIAKLRANRSAFLVTGKAPTKVKQPDIKLDLSVLAKKA